MTSPPPKSSSPSKVGRMFNKLRDYAVAITLKSGRGYRVNRTPTGTTIEFIDKRGKGGGEGGGRDVWL